MNLSYWEYTSWFSNIDYAIVGSGIVGLCCALRLRERFPDAKILILERGALPQGASTKNAGFACFGSISEILDDLKKLHIQSNSRRTTSIFYVELDIFNLKLKYVPKLYT